MVIWLETGCKNVLPVSEHSLTLSLSLPVTHQEIKLWQSEEKDKNRYAGDRSTIIIILGKIGLELGEDSFA